MLNHQDRLFDLLDSMEMTKSEHDWLELRFANMTEKESETPIPHGFAVAWGLICELLLSHRYLKFPSETISELAAYIYRHYRAFPLPVRTTKHSTS